jgi:predicted XRE-type DNA-binding protein
MSRYYIQPLDPQEIAARFSQGDGLEPLPETDTAWKDLHIDKINAVMDRLPSREADLIRLYYFRGKRQVDIAEIFQITQAAVSYRLQRAIKRIRFLVEIPDVTKEQIFKDLNGLMSELDARIFSEMFISTCQSEVAQILKISQGRVRHRFIANLARLGEHLVTELENWSDAVLARDENEDLAEDLWEVCDGLEDYLDARVEGTAREITAPEHDGLYHLVAALRGVESEDIPPKLMIMADYYRTFLIIRYNFNILREIRLPKWTKRPTRTLV